MKDAQLTDLLRQLNDEDWQAITDGQSLCLIDDEHLVLSPAGSPNTILGPVPGTDPQQLRLEALADPTELLARYYRSTPLSPTGFRRQVEALVQHHGAAAFAAEVGDMPERSLFVDEGTVVAEDRSSPRHAYGAHCVLAGGTDTTQQVTLWITRGEAYEHYLSMNVCRYNC